MCMQQLLYCVLIVGLTYAAHLIVAISTSEAIWKLLNYLHSLWSEIVDYSGGDCGGHSMMQEEIFLLYRIIPDTNPLLNAWLLSSKTAE